MGVMNAGQIISIMVTRGWTLTFQPNGSLIQVTAALRDPVLMTTRKIMKDAVTPTAALLWIWEQYTQGRSF